MIMKYCDDDYDYDYDDQELIINSVILKGNDGECDVMIINIQHEFQRTNDHSLYMYVYII